VPCPPGKRNFGASHLGGANMDGLHGRRTSPKGQRRVVSSIIDCIKVKNKFAIV